MDLVDVLGGKQGCIICTPKRNKTGNHYRNGACIPGIRYQQSVGISEIHHIGRHPILRADEFRDLLT